MGLAKIWLYRAGAHEAIPVSQTPVKFSADKLTIKPEAGHERSVTKALVTCEGGPAFYTVDGTEPKADGSVGHRLQDGDEKDIENLHNIRNFQVVSPKRGRTILKVTYFFDVS